MTPEQLKAWRKAERERLIAARLALDSGTLERLRLSIDSHLERSFPGLASARLAFCWPIRAEYDARHLAATLRDRGALTALPVVVAPRQPLVFREWHPGVRLAAGPLDIPYPVDSAEMAPEAVLLPMNGWDPAGYRLGYGAGFFDRTLASLARKPVVIGVAYEMARIATIHPQRWDVPVDWLVTERGVYRRDPEGLAYRGEPPGGEDPSALSSPVCYLAEIGHRPPRYDGSPPEQEPPMTTASTPNLKQHDQLPPLASRFVETAALPWTKTAYPGVEAKTLLLDRSSGLLTVLLKMAPGAKLPDHEHVLIEQTYMLEGSLVCGEGRVTAGNFVWRPAGSRHEAWAGPEGNLSLAMFQLPNKFFQADGRVLDFLGKDWREAWGGASNARALG